jgi:hypothetical protein
MGNAIASFILCQIAEQPFSPLQTGPATSLSQRKKLWAFVRRAFPECGPHIADSDNADYILDTVFDACAGRSVISGDSGNVCLVPWEFNENSFNPPDLVLMTTTEAKAHLSDRFQPTFRLEQATVRIRQDLA